MMPVRTDTTYVCDTCPAEELVRKGMNTGWRFITIKPSPRPGDSELALALCPSCAAPVEGAIKPKQRKGT